MRRLLINILCFIVGAVLFVCLIAVLAALGARDWVAGRLRLESERRHNSGTIEGCHAYKVTGGHPCSHLSIPYLRLDQ